jgi:hypothetical protein
LFQSSDRAHVVTPIKLDSYEISPPEFFPKSQAKKCSITRILQLYYSQRTMQRPNRTTLSNNVALMILTATLFEADPASLLEDLRGVGENG